VSSNEYAKVIARLRELREGLGLTLKELESRSEGRWKSASVGSYERGARHLSLERALELLSYYGASITALAPTALVENKGLVFDLRKFSTTPDEFTNTISKYIGHITNLRGDWNGELISLRKIDTEMLQISTGSYGYEFKEALSRRNLEFIFSNRS
jgi:transcriptional regulator with XRE-family HTH domain